MHYIRTIAALVMTTLFGLATLTGLVVLRRQSVWEYWLKAWSSSILRILGVRVHLIGAENIGRPAVYAMNHQGIIDIIALAWVAPAQSTFIAKHSILNFPFVGPAMQLAGCIFVNRSQPNLARASLQEGLKNLPAQYSVLIFPEGTRSLTGQIAPFKKGAFHVATQAHLPVVPLGQHGGYQIGSARSIWIRPGDLYIAAGAPLDTAAWQAEDAEVHTEQIRRAVINACAVASSTALRADKTRHNRYDFVLR